MRYEEGCLDDYFGDGLGQGGFERMRRGGSRRQSSPPVVDNGRSYLRPKDIIAMRNQPGGMYHTLTSLLEPRVRAARCIDGRIECVSQSQDAVIASLDPSDMTSCVYADHCVVNRSPEQYAFIQAELGFACDVRQGSEQKTVMSVSPAEKQASIHLTHVGDDAEVKRLVDHFLMKGFEVCLYAGGEQPLTTISMNDPHTDVKYSKGTWQKVAERGVAFLMREGYQVTFAHRAN